MGKSGFHQTCKKCGWIGHNAKSCATKANISHLRELFNCIEKDYKRPPYIITKDGVINTNKEAYR